LPLGVGLISCIISFLCGLILIKIDLNEENIEKNIYKKELTQKMCMKDLSKLNSLFWLLLINFGLLSGVFFTFTSNGNSFLV